MGVPDPGSLSSRAPGASGPQPSLALPWTACPWRHAITPALGPTAPTPTSSPLPPRRGEPPPSAPTPMPLTGTAAPRTDPGPGEWSRGSSSRTRAYRRTLTFVFLSYGSRRQLPSDLGQSPPHRPSCDSPPPPSPRRHRHHCLANRRVPLPLGLDPTPAPRVHVPLFRPLEANPGKGLLPPRYQYASSVIHWNLCYHAFHETIWPQERTLVEFKLGK
jgi:hypothetical protein